MIVWLLRQDMLLLYSLDDVRSSVKYMVTVASGDCID